MSDEQPKNRGRAGMGRPEKDPVDYEPNEATKVKRQRAADLFTEQDAEDARQTMLDVMAGLGDSVQLRAAERVLDRIFGKPAQELVFVGDDTKPPIKVDSGILRNISKEDLIAAARVRLAMHRGPSDSGEETVH